MSTTTTWATLIPEIARHVYAGKETILLTATGGSTTTVVDATGAYTSRSDHAYNGMGLFCYDGNTASPARPENEFRRVTEGGFAGSTGTWTVAPAYGTESGTSTSNDATTLTDTTKAWTTNEWVGAIVTIPVTTSGGTMTITGNTATVLTGAAWSTAGDPTDDTSDYTMTVAVEEGDKFILMRGGLDDAQFLDAANAVITSTYWPRYLPYCGSLNDNDGDMEASSADAYTAINVATLAKVATDVYSGTQSLAVTTDAADEGVQSAVFGHHETQTLLISVMIRSSLNGSVILYDETNSEAVRTVTFSANSTVSTTADEWTLVMFWESPPTDSTSLSVRVTTSESTGATWFVDHISVLSSTDQLFKVPPSLKDVSHLDSLMYMPILYSARDADTWIPNGDFEEWPVLASLKDYAGVNSHRFVMPNTFTRPVWIKFYATESALTGLTSTTYGDRDVIEYGTATELVERWIGSLKNPPATLIAKRTKLYQAYQGALRAIEMDRPTPEFKPMMRVRVP